LEQTENSKKFINAVETLVESGEVKNKLAIVKALDWDNTMLSNVLAGRRNVPPDIYKKFTNLYNIEITDPESLSIENLIKIDAKCDVILSVLAEVLAKLQGHAVGKLNSDLVKMVNDRVKERVGKL
jgi:hypothetical protein